MKSRYMRPLSASAAAPRWLHRTLRWASAAIVAVSAAGAFGAMPVFSATASASTVSPTSQLVFYDYAAAVSSVEVYGQNQNGVYEDSCWTTPLTVNYLPNWWWAKGTAIWGYTSTNCSGTRWNSVAFTLTGTPTDPPYHCQEDVYPYSDWNPGSDWHNCAIHGALYGYAVGSLVWHHP